MRLHFGLRAASFLVLLFAAGWPALAQDKPIAIEQAGIQPPIQMGRPIPSWWDVRIKGSALVEGRFEFQLKNDARLLATVTTEDLALTGPQQQIRVLLPPVNDPEILQLQLEIKFYGKRFNQHLGTHILRIANVQSRTFMILRATSRLAPKRSVRDQIVRRLAFESLAVDLDDSVKTVQASLDPVDLPQEPLAYCAYEMVILFGDEFRQLKKSQLDALAAWVRAGGSLYVEPTAVLEPYHVDFLRNITTFGPIGLVIQPDSKGRLIPGTIWNDERLIRVTNGLGRIVIRVDDDEPILMTETPEWREASAFLWRLHHDQIQILGRQPSANLQTLLQIRPPIVNQFAPMQGGRLALPLPTSTTELVNWLMPEGVRMVPLWVLGLILVSFVVWIGPVDYFGLGWLKARKFTWLTFPLATFLVTGLTVWITNQYMSSAETRRGLVLRDIGDDGAIVRTNRFELLFVASTRPVTTEVRKGVFVPMATGQSMMEDSFQRQQQRQMYNASQMQGYIGNTREGTDRPPPRLQGRIPTEFTVTQDLAKWTPQLNRHFWIPGAKPEEEIDWQALTDGMFAPMASTPEMFRSHVISGDLVSRVQRTFGPKSLVAILGPHGQWACNQGNGLLFSGNNQRPSQVMYPAIDEDGSLQGLPSDIQSQPEMFRWLYHYSTAASYGLFSLTSQVGPAGGAGLEDLPILDTSDPTLGLLIVVVPRGDDFIVYRKLLRTGL